MALLLDVLGLEDVERAGGVAGEEDVGLYHYYDDYYCYY